MSLNSVVNKLVRAAASVPTTISDKDLDAHVAKLLAEEAKANDSKWSELGLGAFVGSSSGRDSPDSSLPKPNKRFLSSVIRAVDGHNSALLKQQAESARSARDQQRRTARQDDGKRGANRLFGSALGGVGRESKRDRGSGRTRTEEGGRSRDHERREGLLRSEGVSTRLDRREEDRYRSRRRHSPDHDNDERYRREYRKLSDRRHTDHRDDDRQRRPRQRDSDDDELPLRKNPTRPRSRSRSRERSDRPLRRDKNRASLSPERSPSPKRSARRQPPNQPRPPSASPPPAPPSPSQQPLSRMDKYFKSDYDPRLDFNGVEVPKSGPVTDFGWDSMLSVLRERGKKRRRNSPGLSASPEPVRKPLEKRPTSRITTVGPVEPEKTVMDMEYTKRGQMRAWDVGKE